MAGAGFAILWLLCMAAVVVEPKTLQSDVAALLSLKAGLQNSLLANFTGDQDPCDGSCPYVYQCNSLAEGVSTVINVFISGKGIRGTLSSGIGGLANLQYLTIYDTSIGGILPATLNNLTQLRSMNFFNNLFFGSIPSMQDLGLLQYISMASNRLSGSLEGVFTGLPLQTLNLRDNKLTGPLPLGIGNEANLQIIDLSNNHLTGPLLPAAIMRPLLISLNLQKNSLSGTIPDVFTDIISLNSLDLSGNSFSGTAPPSLQRSESIIYLNLDNNNLTGSIPNIFHARTTFPGQMSLLLANNSFTGTIPQSIATYARQTPFLVTLDFSNNKLGGPLPAGILGQPGVNTLITGNGPFCGPSGFPACPYSPPPYLALGPPPSAKHPTSSVGAITGGIAGAILFAVLCCTGNVYYRRHQLTEVVKSQGLLKTKSSQLPMVLGGKCSTSGRDAPVRLSYDDIITATCGFHFDRLLGRGGFGHVYRGVLSDGQEVAVKVLNKNCEHGQGQREYEAEVETISRVHHRHLVKLIGFCSEGEQRILVYEYLANGDLHTALHGSGKTLSWKSRVKVAVGAAKGLAYLHEGCAPRIVHRDIKPSNILLDESFEAKIADFGLAKIVPDGVTTVTTRVLGTLGYVAPEYAGVEKVGEKADVYSYGMVVLELVSGKKPFEYLDLQKMASGCLDTKELQGLADPKLLQDFKASELEDALKVALLCIQTYPHQRPEMGDVVRMLEGDLDPHSYLPQVEKQVEHGFPYELEEEGMKDTEPTNNGQYLL